MTVRKMEHVALGVTAIAVVVLCSSLMQCAAMPAPPSDAEGDIRSLAAGNTAPPPITEEELHQMLEELLMEAYGDEYEPPASKTTSPTAPKSKSPPSPKVKPDASKFKSPDAGKSSTVSTNHQRGKSISGFLVTSPRPQSSTLSVSQVTEGSSSVKPQRDTFTLPPVSLHSVHFDNGLKITQAPIVHAETLTAAESQLQKIEAAPVFHNLERPASSSLPVAVTTQPIKQNLELPAVLSLPEKTMSQSIKQNVKLSAVQSQPEKVMSQHIKQNFELPAVLSLPEEDMFKSTTKISKLATNPKAPAVSPTIVQSLTSAELKGAVLVEQEDQPNILIVDRRTKKKEDKELLATKMFEDAARNSRSPAATNQPAPTSAIALEPISLDAFASSDSNLDSTTSSLIQSATLISHIKSEGDQPFTTVTGARRKTKSKSRNENIPTTSPNVLLVSQAQVTDDKQSSKSQSASNSQSLSNSQSSANSQSSTNSQSLPNFQLSANSQSSPNSQAFSHSSLTSKPSSNVANVGKSLFDNDGDLLEATRAFTLPNLQAVINPPFRTPVLDVDDVDDDDLLLLQLLGSRMNQAGFKSEQSITPAIKLGSSLNLGPPSSFRTPLNTNSISTSPASESRASPIPGVFTDDNKIVIDLGTLGGVGAPLPLLSGTGNRQENFFTVKEIGSGRNTAQAIASNRPTPTLVTEAGQPVDARMTVGDLIRSLDGLNGIQVLSLSDLRNQQKQAAVSTTGTTIAERLRDAMLSGTPTNGFQNVGVPLPSGNLGNVNQVGISSPVQATSGSAGRQADQTATDSLTADSIFDNFFDESSVNSGASSNVGVPLPTVTDNATPADTTSDSFLTTTSDDTNGFPLEDNTNFDFEEYDDDVSSLPAQPESVFRRGISDIFFTKGQWLGTLFGGVIDVGSAVGDSVSKLFNKSGSGSST